MFVSATLLLEVGGAERIERLLALSEAASDLQPGLFAAFGWCESRYLGAMSPHVEIGLAIFRRLAGTVPARCTASIRNHLGKAHRGPDSCVRGTRAVARRVLGERELDDAFCGNPWDDDPMCQFWLHGGRSAGRSKQKRMTACWTSGLELP